MNERYQIAYDREASTEIDAKYYVYDTQGSMGKEYPIIYKGNYSQCLCVVGAFGLNPDTTLEEINEKTNGFLKLEKRMKPRFTVEKDNQAFKIVDNECKRWNMPKMAVSIFFGNRYRADEICNLLNNEWNRFQANPT